MVKQPVGAGIVGKKAGIMSRPGVGPVSYTHLDVYKRQRIDPTAIQSNMATATASYKNAVKNKERYERLVEAGAISQKPYEDVALNVENARANLTSIQQQMKYTVVNSPMSGIIGEVKVEQGSFATVGMQLGTVVDISSLKMILKVPEEDVIKLKKGQPVSIQTDVYPDHTFKGNITLISVCLLYTSRCV